MRHKKDMDIRKLLVANLERTIIGRKNHEELEWLNPVSFTKS